jgi:hypothetical protein
MIDLRVFLGLSCLVLAPAAMSALHARSVRLRRLAQVWPRIVLVAGLTLATIETVWFFINAIPWLEGVDLYVLIAVARDSLNNPNDVDDTRYFYFPGAFMFWRMVLGMFGHSWPVIKPAYAAVLAANTALVVVLTLRAGGGRRLAVYSAFFYLLLASRLEGFAGLIEPICTIPLLAGLAVWRGSTLAGSRGLMKALALGSGIGLALYVKQQAGLLALGYVTLIPYAFAKFADQRHGAVQLLAIPLSAVFVLLVAVLAEGRGLLPLSIGLTALSEYSSQGTLVSNLKWVWQNLGAGLQLIFVISLSAFCIVATTRRRREILFTPWFRVAIFLIVAALASLIQFQKRPYLHYALLTAAMAAPGIALILRGIISNLPGSLRNKIVLQPLLLLILMLPFVRPTTASSGVLYFFPLRTTQPVEFYPIRRADPAVSQDLETARRFLRPGEDVLVLPPRRNEVHLTLGTRSRSYPHGYRWAPADAAVVVQSESLDGVVVLKPPLDSTDVATWNYTNSAAAVAALPLHGFVRIADLERMSIWRRVH